MAFNIFYIKSGGIANNSSAAMVADSSARTGAFGATSTYYPSVLAALATGGTAPVAGDRFYISSASVHSYGINTSFAIPVGPAGLAVISVNDSFQDQSLIGAEELTGGTGNDFTYSGAGALISYHGVDLEITDDINLGTNTSFLMVDGIINLPQAGNQKLSATSDGGSYTFINTDIVYANGCSDKVFDIRGGNYVNMFGGAIIATTADIDSLHNSATTGGFTSRYVGVNLTTLQAGVISIGSGVGDDAFSLTIEGCILSSAFVPANEEFTTPQQSVSIINSSSVSADAEFEFYKRTYSGDVEDQQSTGTNSIVRTESTAFPAGEVVSAKLTPSSTCSISQPLIFNLPSRFCELATASTDTLRFYFVVLSATTLTDTNFWAELVYPDGTTKQVYNFASNRNSDIIATGTTHTTDSVSVWENNGADLTGYNEYRMDLSTAGDIGANGVPEVRVYCAIPSVIIYLDTEFDLVA